MAVEREESEHLQIMMENPRNKRMSMRRATRRDLSRLYSVTKLSHVTNSLRSASELQIGEHSCERGNAG
jgi:hypothetical protein